MSLSNVQIAEQENECKDATEDLEESKKFFADLEVNCEQQNLQSMAIWQILSGVWRLLAGLVCMPTF